MFNITPTVRLLLFVNVGVFLLTSSLGASVVDRFALHSVLSDQFSPIQFITHLFMHAGFGHLFSNMLGLIIFGPLLEQFWGPRRFFSFYLMTGLGAAALYLGVNYYETAALVDGFNTFKANPTNGEFLGFINEHAPSIYDPLEPFIQKFDADKANPTYIEQGIRLLSTYVSEHMDTPMVGASGAIFGIIMAFGLLFPNTELFLLFIPFPIKAKYLVGAYAIWEVYSGIYRAQSDNVAHFAHIGGMLFAYIIIKIWGSQRKTFY
ncbi:rhomboid family intramembrane serine protease [Fibrella aquatica]|jgi:membrane associated rhomboid family serine protease|uniref:rhomboid family intramembrane serine protease n=1 Tax=Fibrella aquatica TaxID=3242487 RepID=UPI003522B71B